MKKSFMTRALATGLSFAMAFSLSAATNVTVASAAAKKTSVTSLMKSSSKTVVEGKMVKAFMRDDDKTAKKYRIKSHTETAVAKKYISVKMRDSRRGLEITAKEGALAAAKLEKKGVNVKIYFAKAKSAAAAKKAAATKYVNLKVVVKAAEQEKPEEVKQSIVKAEPTGVKTITLTMAKDVASVASPVAITVKKGSTVKEQKASVEGKVITLAMDTKLMQGQYNITITGLESETLTGLVDVEKDETLTSYKISEVLALKALKNATDNTTITSSTSAICKYQALNQYEEPMTADAPTATCSFGKADVKVAATASVVGEIEVTDIPAVLAIPGTKGTMTLVDGNNGVNQTQQIAIDSPATPAEVTVVGTYNVTTSKMQDIVANSKLGNFYILLTAKDQYGWDVKEFTDDVSINIAGGVTNVATLNDKTKPVSDSICTNVIVDGKEYIAIKLDAGTALAGNYIMTIVNSKKGMLVNATYTVAEDVIVKSISITADNGIYDKQENELGYEVIDTNGNAVKDYATLKANEVKFDSTTYGVVKWVKNTDGTAKLVYDGTLGSTVSVGTSDTASITDTVVVSCNDPKSSNYFVKPIPLTVRKARIVKGVYGLDSSVTTNITASKNLEINQNKIIYLDQYSNKVTKDDDGKLFAAYCTYVTSGTIAKGQTGCSFYFEDKDGAFGNVCTYGTLSNGTDTGFKFTSTGQKGTATVYLKYAHAKADENTQASAKSYDAKFNISNVDTDSLEASSIQIKSINDGNDVDAIAKSTGSLGWVSAVSKSDVKVVATVAGQETEIPVDQWDIIGGDGVGWTPSEIDQKVKTKTVTLEVLVTTWSKGGTEVQTKCTKEYNVSWDDKVMKKIDSVNTVTGAAFHVNDKVTASTFGAFFYIEDQYGTKKDSWSAAKAYGMQEWPVSFEVTVLDAKNPEDDYKIVSNGTKAVSMTFSRIGTYKMKITAKSAKDGSTKTAYVDFVVSP